MLKSTNSFHAKRESNETIRESVAETIDEKVKESGEINATIFGH
jgi:hypothetical protein